MMGKMDVRFKKYWEELHYQAPTPIQEQVYTPLMEGMDVVGLSKTGTGKTVAYALPLLEKVEANRALQLVILTPSQELGVQVGRVLEEWGGLKDIRVQTIIGGANSKRQIDKLKEKPEVVVGTPGRLLELATQRKLKLHQVECVVLDEADYLLQQEHLSSLRELIKRMPGQRQMAFFSATDSAELRDVNKWFNANPLVVDATGENSLNAQTEHGYVMGENRKRVETLRRLANVKGMQALVFVNSVQELDYLAEKMQFEGIQVRMLHSDYGTSQRKFALEEFRKGNAVYLLTTDVSARGIDIEDLPYVINYDLPIMQEVYLHRSGRTGRMGKEGRVLSLVTERSVREAKKMVPEREAFKEWFIHGGDLVTELPEAEPFVKKAKPKVKQAPAPVAKPIKKTRTRPNKNKGARKK